MKYKKGNQKKKLINSEVVRVKDNKRRDLILIALFIFSIAAMVFFYVWQRMENVEMAYQIENIKKELKETREENDSLKLQYEKLIDLRRIEELAVEQLKMRKAFSGELFITKPVLLNVESLNESSELALRRRSEGIHND